MKELRLNKEIFDRESIVAAKQEFTDLCQIDIVEDTLYWNCMLQNCIYDPKETMQEFENYIIDYINSRGEHDY